MSSTQPQPDNDWWTQKHETCLRLIRKQRPVKLRDAGELHPHVAAWGERLLARKAGHLLIGGPVGVTKTWNVFEVLERVVRAGYVGRIEFRFADEWEDIIMPPVDRNELRILREADVLVLDDLGAVGLGQWELRCLRGVIDNRWRNDRPTVITTNVSSLRDALDEPIASRLADDATVVMLHGEDRRRIRGATNATSTQPTGHLREGA